MASLDHEIRFGDAMSGTTAVRPTAHDTRSWKPVILDLATRWYVPRLRDRIATIALTAFAVVGLFMTGGLNTEIVETQSESPAVAASTPLSRLVVEVTD